MPTSLRVLSAFDPLRPALSHRAPFPTRKLPRLTQAPRISECSERLPWHLINGVSTQVLSLPPVFIRSTQRLSPKLHGQGTCRSQSGATVAAIKLKQRDAICNRRDAIALTTMQAARPPDQSRAVTASGSSWAA